VGILLVFTISIFLSSVGVFASVSVLLVIFTTSAFSSMLISALLFFLNLVY